MTSYLVDTDVFSEPAKRRPAPQVVQWLSEHESRLYLSAITIGELKRGIERLPQGERRAALDDWLQRICRTMKGRIWSFNAGVAQVWGQLKAKWEADGLVVPSLDSQIAATAHRHKLTLVTHNTRHFGRTGVRLIDPFE